MTWTQQRQLVNSLSDRAQDKKRDARRLRGKLKGWMSSYFGRPETLAWTFAMGSFWAAAGSSAAKSGATGRSLIAAINTGLLAWQLVHRQVILAQPAANQPSEEQR
jgi:hypothetical protein